MFTYLTLYSPIIAMMAAPLYYVVVDGLDIIN